MHGDVCLASVDHGKSGSRGDQLRFEENGFGLERYYDARTFGIPITRIYNQFGIILIH